LLPSSSSREFGIGLHCSVEDDSLLVITPDAHVPHLDAHTGLWTRYDLSPQASLVSVQLADLNAQAARPPSVGGRYTSRTRVHHTSTASEQKAPTSTPATVTPPLPASVQWRQKSLAYVNHAAPSSEYRADATLTHINPSCAMPSVSSCGRAFAAEPSWACDWTYGRRFKGLVMGSPTTNVIASVILSGPRSLAVIREFRNLTQSPEGPTQHQALGLSGDAHLAVQDVQLPLGALVVARVGTEHREDMHRLLHHCLAPLEDELGVAPYGRMLKAARTARTAYASYSTLFGPAPYIGDPNAAAEPCQASDEPTLHVQHGSATWKG